jgi:RTX calcium-binding nonapeptide repeat (4 copies)
MRISVSLLIVGFLFLFVPIQIMAGVAPPLNPAERCGYPYHEYSVCTTTLNTCPPSSNLVICQGGICNGTDGNDCIIGTEGSDIINAGKGNDRICGFGGADWVKASYGNDVVCGGGDADVIEGGWGADDMNGGPGNDTLDAGQCNDHLFADLIGDTGNGDACNGGLGYDQWNGCDSGSLGRQTATYGGNCPPLPH